MDRSGEDPIHTVRSENLPFAGAWGADNEAGDTAAATAPPVAALDALRNHGVGGHAYGW